jgi:GGDEF domain-containing protein
MKPYSLPVLIICGISSYTGLSRLMLFILRKESRVNLYFALVCFSIAFYDVTCVGLYNAVSVEAGALWQIGQYFGFICITSIFLVFIFALYEKKPTRFKRFYLIGLAALALLGLAFPRLIVSADNPNPRSFEFLGIAVTYLEGRLGPLFILANLWLIIAMGYILKIAVIIFRKREREDAFYFLAGMSLFFVTVFLDTLIANDLLVFIYSTEYGFLALIIMMDLAVQRRFVSLFREVETLNATLEDKVSSRTEEIRRLVGELSSKNEELRETNEVLADLAERDSLTRLLNHAAFHRRLAEELNAARRHSFPLALVMIDIDRFKEINDAHGHQVGDKVILKVAEVLTHSSRDYDQKARYATAAVTAEEAPSIRLYDVPGRYGGDEFAVLLPYCREAEALIVAERIRKKIEAIEVPGFPKLRVGASLGGAVFDPTGGETTGADLMQEADRALYEAKAAGRGRTVIAPRKSV